MSEEQVTEATIEEWRVDTQKVLGSNLIWSDHDRAVAIMRTLLADRDAVHELVAAQRAELCIAYDVIDAMPDSALDAVDDAKLLTLMRTMDDEQKRQQVRDRMGTLVEERDALKAEVERLRADQNAVARRELEALREEFALWNSLHPAIGEFAKLDRHPLFGGMLAMQGAVEAINVRLATLRPAQQEESDGN